MTSPFLIEGPAVISFSGGRTSGYMLFRILQEGIGPDVHVAFANTGKEHEATLDFVHQVETCWRVPITWLEYERLCRPVYKNAERRDAAARARTWVTRDYPPPIPGFKERGFRTVTYETASRYGEPYENLIDLMGLPNVLTRMCTQELKVRVIKKWMMEQGYDAWDNVVGIRADEPPRIAKMRALTGQRWENVLPLVDAGVTKAEVLAFWRSHPFDLELPVDEHGDTVGGNCDLCFLKGRAKRSALARAEPERVAWWMIQEARTGHRFRLTTEPGYDSLPYPPGMCEIDDDLGDCICHD